MKTQMQWNNKGICPSLLNWKINCVTATSYKLEAQMLILIICKLKSAEFTQLPQKMCWNYSVFIS